jgi:hypothetical protein
LKKWERDRLGRIQSASRRLALDSNDSPFGEASHGSDAFGETPKAAGEDARAPQSISMVDFLNHCRRIASSRQSAKKVDVIFHAADDERLAIEMSQDSTEVTMRFLAQRPVAQAWAAVLPGENRVNYNLCERLWHEGRMPETRI